MGVDAGTSILGLGVKQLYRGPAGHQHGSTYLSNDHLQVGCHTPRSAQGDSLMVGGSGLAHLGGYPFEVRYSDGSLVRARASADVASDAYIAIGQDLPEAETFKCHQ
jgi:hypothetical protein